jgi:hypothetical protein
MPRLMTQSYVAVFAGSSHHHAENVVLSVAYLIIDDALLLHTPGEIFASTPIDYGNHKS